MKWMFCFWVIVFSIFVLNSCTQKQDSTSQSDSATVASDSIFQESASSDNPANDESDVSADSEVILPFKEFSIRILNLKLDSPFPESDNNVSRNGDSQELKDTVYLTTGLGETVEDKLFQISTRTLTELTVEQRYETGLAVSTEDWNCELDNWLRFESEWEPIRKNSNGQYLCRAYSTYERRRFPSFSLIEVQKAVDDKCDPKVGAYFRNVTSLQDAPVEIYIRSIYIRISGWDEVQKRKVSRILVFDSQFGC
jgi:hypothetical protein